MSTSPIPRPPASSQGPPLAPGTVVLTRYHLEERLEGSDAGEVWRGLDRTSAVGRAVVVRFPTALSSAPPPVLEGLEQDQQRLASLSHPAIVPVIDVGRHGRRACLVMPYVEGESLAAWMTAHRETKRPPRLATVLSVFHQMCAAVAAAHELPEGITHRDLRPANVIVSRGSSGALRVHVLGFGLGRLDEAGSASQSRIVGTPAYLAPEQAARLGTPAGPWSDVFTLGVLLVQMLTLQPSPGVGRWHWWQVAQRREREIQPLLRRALGHAPELVPLLTRCLAMQPSQRPQDAAELLGLLGASATDYSVPPPSRAASARGSVFDAIAAATGDMEEAGRKSFASIGASDEDTDATAVVDVSQLDLTAHDDDDDDEDDDATRVWALTQGREALDALGADLAAGDDSDDDDDRTQMITSERREALLRQKAVTGNDAPARVSVVDEDDDEDDDATRMFSTPDQSELARRSLADDDDEEEEDATRVVLFSDRDDLIAGGSMGGDAESDAEDRKPGTSTVRLDRAALAKGSPPGSPRQTVLLAVIVIASMTALVSFVLGAKLAGLF